MKGILAWLIGIPIPIIILLSLFDVACPSAPNRGGGVPPAEKRTLFKSTETCHTGGALRPLPTLLFLDIGYSSR
jgi:hypothetical protein